MNRTWGVVLAGGRGTRFWPQSRRGRPKQCLTLTGDRSLLQQAVDRLVARVGTDRILVVTGPDMSEPVREQLPEIPADHVLVEPRGRNTAPAIGWAAVEVQRRGGQAMVVLPSDHLVARSEAFTAVLRDAEAVAIRTDRVVLLGQVPDRPHTGYGWIVAGESMAEEEGRPFFAVSRFVEKPDRAAAERLLGDRALWNGGMIVATVGPLLDAYRRHLPYTADALDDIRHGVDPAEVWDGTDAISFDYGVLERESGLLVARCDVGWSDLGDWPAMASVFPAIEGGVGRAEAVVGVDASGMIVDAPDKLVAMIGVKDLVVVDTGDVLLVCARAQVGKIPEILRTLAQRELDEYL